MVKKPKHFVTIHAITAEIAFNLIAQQKIKQLMCANSMKGFLLTFALFFYFNLGFSQTNELTVRFIGNCGFSITDGVSSIYFDFPYKSGAHKYSEYNLSELDSIKDHPIFIYTHRHSDHYSGKLVRRSAKKNTGQVFTPRNVEKITQLNNTVSDFKIETFHTKHNFSFNHYSYLITWHGKKIFISGDTENPSTIATLKGLDWAFVPAWLVSHAQEQGISLQEISTVFAIYHIGPRDTITSDATNTKIKLLNKQGEIIHITY